MTALVASVLSASASGASGPVPGVPDVSVTVTPSPTTTATTVTATVTASVDSGVITCVTVDFGDTTGRKICMFADGPEVHRGGDRVTYSWKHAYRRAGVWPVIARATAEGPDAEQRDGVGASTVVVMPGASPSNGPAEPSGFPGQSLPPGGSRRDTTVDVEAGDEDGFVTEVVVDWGDGRKDRRTFDLAGCSDLLLTWPSSRTDLLRFTHRYRAVGDRTVTTRVVSKGCDGADTQTRVERLRVQVPARF